MLVRQATPERSQVKYRLGLQHTTVHVAVAFFESISIVVVFPWVRDTVVKNKLGEKCKYSSRRSRACCPNAAIIPLILVPEAVYVLSLWRNRNSNINAVDQTKGSQANGGNRSGGHDVVYCGR